MIAGWILAGSILLLGSIYDLKDFKLPIWLLQVGMTGGFFCLLLLGIGGELKWWELLLGILPGCISIGLSFLTKEQIGYGDGLLLLILAGCIGRGVVFYIWLVGLLFSALISVVLIVAQKAAKNTKIPFVPCLFGGYVIIGIMEVMNV